MCVLSSKVAKCAALNCWFFELNFLRNSPYSFGDAIVEDTCQVIVMVTYCDQTLSRLLPCILKVTQCLGIANFILYAMKVVTQKLNTLPKLSQLFNWDLHHTTFHVFCIMLPQSVIIICFLCRQNPETTFEVYVEVACPRTGGTLSGTRSPNYDNDMFFHCME